MIIPKAVNTSIISKLLGKICLMIELKTTLAESVIKMSLYLLALTANGFAIGPLKILIIR